MIAQIGQKSGVVGLILCLLSGASVADDITVTVYATPSGAEDSVWLGRGALQQSVVDHMDNSPTSIKVIPGDPSSQPQEIYLQWHDTGNSSGIPIFTLNAFSGSNLRVFFSRQEVTPDNVRTLLAKQCRGSQPQNVQDAFKAMYVCRSVYFYVKEVEQGRMTLPVRTSLNAWFIANNYLYKQPSGSIPFSPFGLQDDLVQELQTFTRDVDDNNYNTEEFAPLRVIDIKAALQAKQTESIRMAGLVPGLISAGKFNEATSINDAALASFRNLAEGKRGGIAIEGVTEKVLKDNQSYIRTLSQ